jgi:membrane protease YdiL (CAAX protease family)
MKNMQTKQSNRLSTLAEKLTQEKAAGIAFSAATLLPALLAVVFLIVGNIAGLFVDGYEEKDWYRYCNFLLPQVAFCLIGVFYFCVTKKKPSSVASVPKARYFLIAVLLQAGLFALGDLNGYFLEFLERFGYKNTPIELPSLDGAKVVGVLVVVALLPALFEELIFRGILLKGLRSFPVWAAALLCGGLFSIFHMNPAQTLYQFCCGVAFAYVAVRSGSILPTMLMHLLNNGTVILLEACGASIERLPLPAFIASLVCLIATLAYLIFVDQSGEEKREKGDKKGFFLFAGVGILVSVLTWVSVLLGGV